MESLKKFSEVAATETHPHWEKLIQRDGPLYSRADDIRSDFARDYTRILHSMAYRRLKHKTQVFFNIKNDHVCTRIEHVSHVESVSSTIARYLGLNEELTKAISIAHDLGHAPFGHQGENVIKELMNEYLEESFWHEKNGLYFVDQIELLEDNYKDYQNLMLTYAVRDGILSHCGEVDHNGLRPRDIAISLEEFDSPGKYQAATWEGCVVKLADKIAYIGRDIEDAITLGFLDQTAQDELLQMARAHDAHVMNTTVIMHNLVIDICTHSSPEAGICLSPSFNAQLEQLKKFNYAHIYNHERLAPFKAYVSLVIHKIFDYLLSLYDGEHTFGRLSKSERYTPHLVQSFTSWLIKYCSTDIVPEGDLRANALKCKNKKIYEQLQTKKLYIRAIIDYISGMTDHFAITVFNELLSF